MDRMVTIEQAAQISKTLHEQGKSIVLTGGCFDILHIGHIALLEQAKKYGDVLFVFLESDEKIKQLKGPQRPIHTQAQRAKILASLRYVDFVIMLPNLTNDAEYATLVAQIQPTVIAITNNDPYKQQKEEQARAVGAKVTAVTRYIPNVSTTHLAKLLEQEK